MRHSSLLDGHRGAKEAATIPRTGSRTVKATRFVSASLARMRYGGRLPRVFPRVCEGVHARSEPKSAESARHCREFTSGKGHAEGALCRQRPRASPTVAQSYLQPDFSNPGRARAHGPGGGRSTTIVTDLPRSRPAARAVADPASTCPRYNVLLKDDKSFPYVRISVQEEFPRLSVTRQVRNDGGALSRPHTDVRRLRRTLREIRRECFPSAPAATSRDHRKADRPCLYYTSRRCMGPCTRRAASILVEYRGMVDSLPLFLTGRDVGLACGGCDRRWRRPPRRGAYGSPRARDQIDRLLERARVPQKMMVADGPRHGHPSGWHATGSRAAVVALIVRGGACSAQETRMVERAGACPTRMCCTRC